MRQRRRRLTLSLIGALVVVTVTGCAWMPDRPEGPALDVVWYTGELGEDGGSAVVTASVINYGTDPGSATVSASVSRGGRAVAEGSRSVSLDPDESKELSFSLGPLDPPIAPEEFNYSVSVRPD